jgi:hypothetical protein
MRVRCAIGQRAGTAVSRLGAITLAETPLPKPDVAAAMAVLCQAIRKLGLKALPFSSAGLQLRDRIGFLHRSLGAPWPDVSDEALLEGSRPGSRPISQASSRSSRSIGTV